MTPTTNHGTDIQCEHCKSYIFHGDMFVHGYDGNNYHVDCMEDKRMELESEYIDEYNGEGPERSAMLKLIAIEYNDITCDNVEKRIKDKLKKQKQ